ncbi:MAG: tetratricopeptide repeat protein [Gemmatimonadota bacterium]|nr:tetratricopeptide repeat protein [Gemmatimonadota bacterium]
MSIERLIESIQLRRLPHWLVVYAAAAWGCLEATGFLIDAYGAPPRLLDVVLFLLFVFFFLVVVLGWYHGEKGPQRPTRVEGSLLGTLLCIAVVGSIWIMATGEEADGSPVPEGVVRVDLGERSLAVLPFRSTVADSGFVWLDRGVAELLSTKLAQVEDLRVVSSQRLLDLAGQLGVESNAPIPERVVSTLMQLSGARLAVTGSVFGRPGDLTITATLVEASTGEIRASANARGDDVFVLVDEIATVLRDGMGSGGGDEEPASIASLTTASIDAYRAYEEGRGAFQRFLYDDAERHFERALSLDSTFALARFRRALTLYQLGELSEAASEARRARTELGQVSERDRLFVEAFDHFGTDTTAAVATVRELLAKYPDEKDARIIFASILAGVRGAADTEARALLVETLKLDPSYAPGYNILAYSYAGSGDLEAADSLSQRYVELEPDEPNPWDSRGEILELAGRIDDAREAYREALRIRPDFRFAINHLARSYLRENDPAGARQELAKFRESDLPDVRIRAMALEADSYLWEGEVDEAIALYESAERAADMAGLSTLRVWRLRDLVQVRLALGQHAGAVEAAETIRGLEPLDGWWITALYDSLASVGDVAEMERWRPRVQAEIGENPLTRERLPMISRLIDVWIAHARGDHREVLALASELPDAMRPGVLTGWPVFQSMLELREFEQVLGDVRGYRSPDLFVRGPRFEPLRVRWAQYFEARTYEAAGDTAAAVAGYLELARGLGDGLARFPTLSDVPTRLERLLGSDADGSAPS